MAVTLLIDGREVAIPNGQPDGDDLWLPDDEVESATGWHLEPEGLCRDQRCVPVPSGANFVEGGRVNIAAFARHLGQPVVRSDQGDVWAIGSEAPASGLAMPVRPAPDFSLPDASGHERHSSEWKGQKLFLVSWASW